MKVLRELRCWLGRPGPARKSTPARLRIESLEDRLTPDANPATNTELLAVTRSNQPLRDLQNVVAAFDLSASIDLSRSTVVLSSGTTSLLEVGLTSIASSTFIQQKLLGTGLYTSVAPNFIYSSSVGDLRERVPNDPLVGQQYYQTIIQAPTAWDTTVGTPGVVVAILDDGVSITHPDLRNNVWTNTAEIPGDGVDNDGNGFTDDVNGWNFVGNNNNVNPTDPIADAHGTEVAGVLAAQIDNAAGIAGVAGGIRFMPLKVVDSGGGTTSLTLARAISYAVQNGAKIINTSINVDPFADDPTYTAAMDLAYDRGLLLVNSAGNTNVSNPPRVRIEDALFVAASDRNDVKTAYSNYGSGIDITAPGGTADDGLLTTIPVSGYAATSGTSMATPLVAGVAALVWSAFPTYTRDQVAAAVLANADSLLAKNPDFEDQLGSGRLNAAKAVSGNKIVTKLGKLTGLPAEGADSPPSITSFNLRLQSPLDPATVNTSNFELRWAGPDNRFGTADDKLLPLEINGGRDYKIGTNDLSFAVNQSLDRGLYRFTAKSGGLRDPFGSPVDGDGNGTAGGNLVRNFGVAYQVSGIIYDDVEEDGEYDPTEPPISSVQVFADVNGNGRLESQTYGQEVGLPIPDAGPSAVATIVVAGQPKVGGGVSVDIELVHPNTADLTIVLVAPDGTRVKLLDHRALGNFASGSTFDLHFEDGTPESVSSSDRVTSYRLAPVEPFTNLFGHVGNGNWQVEVTDAVAGSVGTLTSVMLTFPSEPTAVTDANGFFAFNGLPPGQYPVTVIPPAGYRFAAGSGSPVVIDTTNPNAPPVTVGLVQTAGIVGRVLLDTNKPVGLATVFVDANRDGVLNPGEQSTTTNANGYYTLPGLPAGTYPVTVMVPAGYQIPVGGTARLSVALTPDAPLAVGSNFTLQRNTSPATVTITPVTPAVRNDSIQSIDFTLSEQLSGLSVANLSLTRDGQQLSLDGSTLINVGLRYSLLGLGDLTAAAGTYAFGVAAPAPTGEPARQPAGVSTQWTVDTTAPVFSLDGIYENNGLVGLTVFANKPITGLDVSDFAAFDINGRAINIQTSTLDRAADGLSAVLRFPSDVSKLPYIRVQLKGADSGIQDAAGNLFLGDVGLAFSRPIGQTNDDPPLVHRTVLGADAGGSPTIRVLDTATGVILKTFVAFEPGFTGGVRVATGDVNGDGVEDIIAAAGPGAAPWVRIFDGKTFAVLSEFMAFEDTFTGGLFVSAGDLNGDGIADLVLSPDVGGGPRVRILDGSTLGTLADFFGIADENFRGGARTAIGDLNGDGSRDLIVAAGAGGGPRVAGYDGRSLVGGAPQKLFNDFFAFDPSLRNGVYLSAGLMDADRFADLVIGAGPGGGPRVLILSGQALTTTGNQTAVADFFSGDLDSRAGVRVAVKPSQTLGSTSDLFTADGLGAGSRIRQYAGADVSQGVPPTLSDFGAFDGLSETFSGAYVG
ncbi:S8 family serine peptidase [Limnoglobus roseus]|uniref:P/Homo B domain-containing protein n=1 Tax=Limnoglobus roseus TaxID=2598579 RepID=A0A5C1ADE4_9BACT|nr:S8 family serine peptidase [Limnoglobus roseus]QEL17321.1 hypothetical protein PX52LOC_04304 [Limnoglobus roseus]